MRFLFFLFMIVCVLLEKIGYFKEFESDRVKRADYYANTSKKWYHKFLGFKK